jgi:hypothetical protein
MFRPEWLFLFVVLVLALVKESAGATASEQIDQRIKEGT